MMLRRQSWVALHRLHSVGRYLPALLLVVLAVADVLTLTLVHPWGAAGALIELFALNDIGWGHEGIIVTAFLLLMLAQALMRRKRHAWLLSVGLVCFSFIAALTEKASRPSLLLLLGLLIALLVLAPLFPARSDPRALARGYTVLVLGLVALVGHGTAHILIHLLIHLGNANILLLETRPLLFLLRVAAYLLLTYGVVEVLHPVLRVRSVPAMERQRAGEVVRRYGRHSLAHFALGPSLSFFWSDSGRSFLAYHARHGIALVLGDPIGPREEMAALFEAFLALCRRQDWQLAIYQASPQTLDLFARDDIHAIKVGEEAFIDTAAFTLQGTIGAPVRHMVTRAKRGGTSIHFWQGEAVPEPIFAGMRHISTAWLHTHHARSQLGFSMGRFPADWSPDLLTVVALGPDGEVQAFVTWTPLYAGDGWTLDNMRRAPEAVPGTMEYLIAASVEWAKARGYRQISLSLAPLADLSDECKELTTAAPPRQRRISSSARLLQRRAAYLHRRGLLLGHYHSLYFFKQKFHPVWEPRYLVVAEISTLPRVLIALAVIHGMSWRTLLDEIYTAVRRPKHKTVPDAMQPAWDGARGGHKARRALADSKGLP
jgi:phosphatidylglycerol lysyltransferase